LKGTSIRLSGCMPCRGLGSNQAHRAMVTDADLHSEGSIFTDAHLMEASDLLPHEKVDICTISNGERFWQSVIILPSFVKYILKISLFSVI
jgi:aspartate 1-decarboxylase